MYSFLREVIIGEYIVGKGPDCEGGSCSPPIQMFGVEKVTVHEQWDYGEKGFLKGSDIAIVRLDGIITLFDVMSLSLNQKSIRIYLL